MSWKLRLAIAAAALVSAMLPFIYVFVPFNTGPLRCGAPWDDAFIDPQETVARSGLTDVRDQRLLRDVLDTCKAEARQRIAAPVSVALMILVVDGICLVMASRAGARPQLVAQHELLHFA